MQDKITVLIIEDEELWAHKMKYDLELFGFHVTGTVDCVEDALTAISRGDFDIALVDINLNGKNSGIELGRMLNQHAKKPFIFVTGSTHGDLLAQATLAHPSAYLTKPVHTASLFVSIQSAIHHFQSGMQKIPEKNKQNESPFFFVKAGNRYKKIDWLEVWCLRSERNYTSVTTSKRETFLVRSSLQRMLQFVIPATLRENFIQVNRAEILQVNFIDEIVEDEALIGAQAFQITDNYGKELKQRLKMLT